MQLEVVQITDNSDGSCNVMFEMDEQTKQALIMYAIKDILEKQAKQIIEQHEPQSS